FRAAAAKKFTWKRNTEQAARRAQIITKDAILNFEMQEATNSAEYRAAASVRAASFYTYPADRSEFAARSHRRMKLDAEWEAIENKVSGTDTAWSSVQVSCLLATISLPPNAAADVLALAEGLDPTCKLPADGMSPPKLVVGTLDVNVGERIPAEELMGTLPKDCVSGKRAYLSNVCVASSARRNGIAMQLVKAANTFAFGKGVEMMYVHVADDNPGAYNLYTGAGFVVEAEESTKDAHALCRARRYLLRSELS
ncbi:hypothetical protein CYMTET_56559, partial [Cymbomonas tetramitiformis]